MQKRTGSTFASTATLLAFLFIFQAGSLGEPTVNYTALAPYSGFAYQEHCAESARQFSRQMGSDNDPLTTFTSHYNERLHRCFLETQTIIIIFGGGVAINRSLTDTAGRDYANITFVDRSSTDFHAASEIMCNITLSSGDDISCDAVSAFDEYVQNYMN